MCEHDLIYYYRQGKSNVSEAIYLVHIIQSIISPAAKFSGRIAQTMIFHTAYNTLNFSNWFEIFQIMYEIDHTKLLSSSKLILLILSLLKSITVYYQL